MPRRARNTLTTSFFHVMVQGVNKELIFKENKYKEKYLQILKKTNMKYKVDVIAYAIMYNHAHLLIHTDNIRTLSKFMKKINEDYGRYYNYMENRVGPIFRDRFLSEQITNRRYLINCIAYIHNNPVKAGIVKKCENYKYSSYTDYLNNTEFIDERIIELVFGQKSLDLIKFKNIHLRKTYYFADCENSLENNMEEIIKELEERYKCKIENIIKDSRMLRNIVIEIKDRIRISNRSLSKILKINRNKINQILK